MSNLVIIEAKLNKNNFINRKSLDNDNIIIYHNVGCLISLNEKLYVLTCFHCLKNTYDQKIYFKKKSYYGRVTYVSDELELGLLEIEEKIISKTSQIEDFQNNLDLKKKNLIIKTKDLN